MGLTFTRTTKHFAFSNKCPVFILLTLLSHCTVLMCEAVDTNEIRESTLVSNKSVRHSGTNVSATLTAMHSAERKVKQSQQITTTWKPGSGTWKPAGNEPRDHSRKATQGQSGLMPLPSEPNGSRQSVLQARKRRQAVAASVTTIPVDVTSSMTAEESNYLYGSDFFTDEDAVLERFELNDTNCNGFVINADRGEIHGLIGGDNEPSSRLYCQWKIQASAGLHLVAVITLGRPCRSRFVGRIYERLYWLSRGDFDCEARQSKVGFSESNIIQFRLRDYYYYYENSFMPRDLSISWTVRFKAVEEKYWLVPDVVYKSPTQGVITPFSLDGRMTLLCWQVQDKNPQYTINLPSNSRVMISFPFFNLGTEECTDRNYFQLMTVSETGEASTVWKKCVRQIIPAQVYNQSLSISYLLKDANNATGFKMLFSFHDKAEAPVKLDSGLFDCSSRYNTFRQHLHCNLDPECHGGEDEGEHCPYSPPGCNGMAGYNNKCYRLVSSPKPVTASEAARSCEEAGGQLAMMKNPDEWEAFNNVFLYGKLQPETLIGVKNPSSAMPDMYRFGYMWKDGHVVLGKSVFVLMKLFKNSFYYFPLSPDRVQVTGLKTLKHFMCQFLVNQTTTPLDMAVSLPEVESLPSHLVNTSNRLIGCQSGHVTHEFLSCDPESHCVDRHLTSCVLQDVYRQTTVSPREVDVDHASSVDMFSCESKRSTVHFTLVCDFREDCSDGTDESFCHHPGNCEGFTCSSGQCLAADRECDFIKNCLDGSDEHNCNYVRKNCQTFNVAGANHGEISYCWRQGRHISQLYMRYQAPAAVYFDHRGGFHQEKLNSSQLCPATHFRCPGEVSYCLPVYVRCNGVLDCPGGEDEADCDTYTCPGFYRCRASSVCVHVQHLCDGMSQCPQRDDELLCHVTCPEGCYCQGLAFVCYKPFPANHYPELRYLDARNSGMAPRDLTHNTRLIWLSLSACDLKTLPTMTFDNLRHLDMSHNKLTSLDINSILPLRSLRHLSLAMNPIVSVFSGSPDALLISLKSLDISGTLLPTLDDSSFDAFPEVQFLNVSFMNVRNISRASVQRFSKLSEIDMTGVRISSLEDTDGLFKGLERLRMVRAESYRLCCSNVLPDNFDENFCSALEDDVSSCEYLLKSDIQRLFVWVVCLMTIVGNFGCILQRLLVKNINTKIGVLILQLHIANMLMGCYLAIIGSADSVYSGSYMLFEDDWLSSPLCKTAGFLWMLSAELSTGMICLITLDRYMVVCSPPSLSRFKSKSVAALACVVVWVLAIVLSSIPLLPQYIHWQFYSQNGVCLPLPVTRGGFQGGDFAFCILFVLNTAQYLAVAYGQFLVQKSLRRSKAATELSTNVPDDVMTARCLVYVAMLDCLSWITLAVVAVIFRAGLSSAADPTLHVCVYLLPLTSAINPLLYTSTRISQKRKLVELERLTALLKSRVATSKK